ncbi:hypothetical protein GW793_03815 [bacterium]|uniref:Uncharacterized protein n=1 Tax=candidate division WWE3 bacterium CG_4_9_14_3_um_filter_39_7 TaxID=1975080 RepID=A0A2M7X348_UNCKA|nr:hypothetical protein [bacterium]PJA40612.1 MAG: hypothetical protein CO179_01730 [candidate division WWE3 bacterium CG_4_9_14_3_um_filter_39_7]
MKTSSQKIKLILVAVLGAFTIKIFPYLFSAEEFAHIFYPYGGLMHEAIGALLVTFLLVIAVLFFKDIHTKNLIKISIISAFLVSMYDISRYTYNLGLTHSFDTDYFSLEALIKHLPANILYLLIFLILGFTYYFLLLSLPFLTIVGVKHLFSKN